MAPILTVRGLTTVFGTGTHELRALDGVDLTVNAGQIVALVGESGSGKSLTGFSINGLLPGDARVTAGSIHLGDTDLRTLPPREMRQVRGRRVGMIFQDPMMTLNPVLRVETQMRDALLAHSPIARGAVRERLVQALAEVGIAAPEQRLRAWPRELSGGMRQRVAIATALLQSPQLVIADEPTTALDVTIQGQILALAQQLCRDRGTALVWITHDLAVVAGIADRVSVMYAGRVVEEGTVGAVLDTPAHPYTRGLIDSVAAGQPKGTRLSMIPGRMPLLSDLPQGCAFAARCAHRAALCDTTRPEPRPTGMGQTVRCHYPLTEPAGAMA
ncbi:MAG: ABC transporter ATP-binding protein [Paracoccaceae bacterium]